MALLPAGRGAYQTRGKEERWQIWKSKDCPKLLEEYRH